MSTERWHIVKEILADAREQPESQRNDWLQRSCGEDAALVEEVKEFLALEDQLPDFLNDSILSITGTGSAEGAGRPEGAGREVGRRIGPYRLVRLIAEGGMGAVYLADREAEFEQRVALKLVRRGLGSGELTRRFHHERQILARLEHPNIARLLDGGATEDGTPYFAMEWIQGVPIDQYCDEHGLNTRQRLELILPVCSALSLAHQNLVVHRDLKPGNLLVDDTGTPKLLDFGIAKLLDGKGEGTGEVRLDRNSALTPRYASPEQLRGEAISTASDVYSLGVVLHQLLTGTLPPSSATVRPLIETTRQEARGTESPPAAKGETARPALPLHGDLEAILHKALQPEPRQRYDSIEQLAADLHRFLKDLPVRARQGNLVYRAGKFLRRHRLGAANGALIFILILIFTVALVRQFRETERSRDQAQGIATFLTELFLTASPDRPAGDEPTVRDLLDAGRERLRDSLEQDPAVRAMLLLRLGEVYSKLGDYGEARQLLVESIALLRQHHDAPHPDLATALSDLAAVHFHTGDREAAEALYRESLEMRRQLGNLVDAIKPMNNLATILMAQDKFREAEVIYRESLVLRRQLLATSPDDPATRANLATSLRSLATALFELGDLDGAEPLLVESLELRREVYGPDSAMVATVELSLGRLAQARGRFPEAERWITRGLATRRRELGDDHPHTALARRDLARLKIALGQPAEAQGLLHRAQDALAQVRRGDDPDLVEVRELLEGLPSPP